MQIQARIHLQIRASEYSDPYYFTRSVELNTPPFPGSVIVVDFGSYTRPTQLGLAVDHVEDLVFSCEASHIYPGVDVFVEDLVSPSILIAMRQESAKRIRGWSCQRLGGRKK